MRRRAILLMATIGAAVLLASGVALAEIVTCDSTPPCYGTPERDDITGTASGETIYMMGGNDRVFAGGGVDTIYGSSGTDELYGEQDKDKLYGDGGNDSIDASFNDTSGSKDRAYGGGGDDFIVSAFDGNVDIIDCGKGTADEVTYDDNATVKDTVKNCEIKHPQ
jgi:Ca2+-binding RTX toxin-like protein